MSTLKEKIDADLKDAMRSKNELATSVLRMLKSSIKYKEVEPGAQALDDGKVLTVINTLIKQRRDSAEQFRTGARADLAEKEEKEIAILQQYLPTQASADEVVAQVKAAITSSGAKGPKDMGAVMKLVMANLAGKAEGKVISEAVKTELSKLSP